jgi:signal transduction histidine kinase
MRQRAGWFSLQAVNTLAAGVAILEQGEIDVVLLDLGLPDSSGFSTFTGVRAAARATPIIILTVLDDEEMAVSAMRMGVQDYLLKESVDKNLLSRAIRYAMERARAEGALRQLSGRILRMQDDERRRIARALHDITAQTLAALSMNLSLLNARAAGRGGKTAVLLAESLALAERCSRELRTTSYLLHPPLLDELGLAGAIREYADGFAERSGIRVDLELPPALPRLSKEAETGIFRVMQESLANIHRHSGSRTASISLTLGEGEISLRVHDTGKGMPREHMEGGEGVLTGLGVGIAGMRERMRQLGGRVQIVTGGGTTVVAVVPIGEVRP